MALAWIWREIAHPPTQAGGLEREWQRAERADEKWERRRRGVFMVGLSAGVSHIWLAWVLYC